MSAQLSTILESSFIHLLFPYRITCKAEDFSHDTHSSYQAGHTLATYVATYVTDITNCILHIYAKGVINSSFVILTIVCCNNFVIKWVIYYNTLDLYSSG